jgi:acyl-[acyl-carrier-protein]-phospholipid O-acyltransferase / long-chain-fatty-acid--[acyl-carrier-protein] ligase
MFGRFKKILNFPFSYREKQRSSLTMLNITQFLGVINDNLFKFALIFLLLDSLGSAKSGAILSATGVLYVAPFLFFSSSAGILADRFSKQKLLVIMKIAEMTIMFFAFFAFAYVSVLFCYVLLFLLSTHSALFGPSKYGIIPELVTADRVSRANGLITSFTYLAIIIGTFLASFLTQITQREFTLIIGVCFLIALGGFLSALRIHRTPSQGSTKKFNIFFVREVFATLTSCREIRHLLPAICGSAYFLFLGGFTQLNIIPYAMQCLNLSEVAGGYFFLMAALGIALGSYLGGKASKKRIELGLSCCAGLILALLLYFLGSCSTSIFKASLCLVLIGIFGGIFIVPFDTFIQMSSPNAKRGQVIGATNFLSFLGVLIASILLYIFPKFFQLSPAGSFYVMAAITLLFTIMQILLLIDLFVSYLARKILHPLYRFQKNADLEKCKDGILILENGTWKEALLLLGLQPNLHFLIPSPSKKKRFFYFFHPIMEDIEVDLLLKEADSIERKGGIPCLFLKNAFPKEQLPSPNQWLNLFKKRSRCFYFLYFQKEAQGLILHLSKNQQVRL